MGRASDELLETLRTNFPASLVGTWSTIGDGRQMEFGHSVRFDADGTGIFEMWDLSDEEEPERTVPFCWRVKEGFVVEVSPAVNAIHTDPEDWGAFQVDFYISEDAYRVQSIAIRDGNATAGREPFWWFANPEAHPMQAHQSAER